VIPFPSWTQLIGGIVSERMLFPAFAACHSLQIHLQAHKSEGRANIADSGRIAAHSMAKKKKKKKEENDGIIRRSRALLAGRAELTSDDAAARCKGYTRETEAAGHRATFFALAAHRFTYDDGCKPTRTNKAVAIKSSHEEPVGRSVRH